MKPLIAFARAVDGLNERIGRLVYWLILAATLISSVNAAMRKAFSLSSNAALEIQWYLFAAVYLLGAGYTLLRDEHVRIDVVSSRLSRRTQCIVDVVGFVVFVLPLCAAIIWMSYPYVHNAYVSGEVSSNTGGLIRWPAYVLVPIGFALLGLQALSELFKRIAFLAGAAPDPHPVKAQQTDEQMLAEHMRLARDADAIK